MPETRDALDRALAHELAAILIRRAQRAREHAGDDEAPTTAPAPVTTDSSKPAARGADA